MARLDVEKNHKNIRKDVSFGPVSNNTTDVNASSKFRAGSVGRTRVPPTGDRDPAAMNSTPAVGLTAKANANLPKPAGNPASKVKASLTNPGAAGLNGANTGRAPGRLMGSGR